MAALSVRDRRQKKERKKVRSFFFPSFFGELLGPSDEERKGTHRRTRRTRKKLVGNVIARRVTTRRRAYSPALSSAALPEAFFSILSFHQIMRGEAESEEDQGKRRQFSHQSRFHLF